MMHFSLPNHINVCVCARGPFLRVAKVPFLKRLLEELNHLFCFLLA